MQTLFIPEKIGKLRLFKLPLSASLFTALKRLKVETFGDLNGMTIKDFQRVSNTGTALFVELNGLTQRARNSDFTAAFRQNVGMSNSSGLRTFHVNAPIKTVAKKEQNDPSTRVFVPSPQAPIDERIFIPQEARGRAISPFQVSVRLRHVLELKRFCILGDLHGISYAELGKFRNCGKKTVTELRELVRIIQRTQPIGHADGISQEFSEPFVALVGDCLTVPASVRDLNFCDLPISVRLGNILEKRKATRFGDLNGVSVNVFRDLRNCGRKTVAEIIRLIERAAAGEFNAVAEVSWNPVELVCTLDALVADLPDRNQQILVLRLGGKIDEVPTLEEVASKFGLTRERVRQIVDLSIERIRKRGSRRLGSYLEHVERLCCEKVCPLTHALLKQWLEHSPATGCFDLAFYVRLLAELKPTIPAWPAGQDASSGRQGRSKTIERGLEAVLREGFQSVPLSEMLPQLRARTNLRNVGTKEFLAALQHSRRFTVEFPKPDAPAVRLARRLALEVAKAVLQVSNSPLTPEEILARAHSLVGADATRWNPRTLGNALVEEKGFYLLGPRSYGLRQHFSLPEQTCEQVRADFRELLKQQNRPVSTAEVVNFRRFDWAERTNTYELACIVRQDERLIDLGKFLFALAEWSIEEREYVKDLIPKVLQKAGRPLTGTEVLARLQQLRSVSPPGIASSLRKHPEVRDYGFGHYGLKSWGNSVKSSIVTDAGLLHRVIRRAVPPLTFVRLCEILDVPCAGELAEKLWQTCSALSNVIHIPEERSDKSRLIHRSCRLERALVATAREVNRPLPLYEFQWELNERFGPLFVTTPLNDLRRGLEHSAMFLRNAADEFILDIHLDQLGLDADAIRRACAEILSESNEIIGCEDMLERLEADGKSWAELSPDILASLLRDDPTFQEVGRDRFRVKACKH
jgi:Sigma-70, region 4